MLRKVSKRKRRVERRPNVGAVAALPPPPKPAQVEMLFTYQPDLGDWLGMEGAPPLPLPPEMSKRGLAARVGRGGRLVFDRAVLDFTEPFTPPPLIPVAAGSTAEPDANKRPKLGVSPGEAGAGGGGAGATAAAAAAQTAPPNGTPSRQADGAGGPAAASPSTPVAAGRGADSTPPRGRGSDKKRGPGRPPKDGKRGTPNGDITGRRAADAAAT